MGPRLFGVRVHGSLLQLLILLDLRELSSEHSLNTVSGLLYKMRNEHLYGNPRSPLKRSLKDLIRRRSESHKTGR